MIGSDVNRKEFVELVEPLMKWLHKNHHPHVTVIVTGQTAELVEGIIAASIGNDTKGDT